MNARPEDLDRLAAIISDSNERAGDFLRSSFEIPTKTLSADQLVRRLAGIVTIALGTVTSTGKPRVAPVVSVFHRAAFSIPTVRDSLRARHIQANPEVSLSLYEGNDFAVIVHGTGSLIGSGDRGFDELVQLHIDLGGGDVREWGDAVYIRVNAERIYSFARYPEQFPGEPLPENQTNG